MLKMTESFVINGKMASPSQLSNSPSLKVKAICSLCKMSFSNRLILEHHVKFFCTKEKPAGSGSSTDLAIDLNKNENSISAANQQVFVHPEETLANHEEGEDVIVLEDSPTIDVFQDPSVEIEQIVCEPDIVELDFQEDLEEKEEEQPPNRNPEPKPDFKVYPCPEPGCDRSYKLRSSLRRHHKRSHLNIRYPCETCNQEFMEKRDLKRHISKRHNNNNDQAG